MHQIFFIHALFFAIQVFFPNEQTRLKLLVYLSGFQRGSLEFQVVSPLISEHVEYWSVEERMWNLVLGFIWLREKNHYAREPMVGSISVV